MIREREELADLGGCQGNLALPEEQFCTRHNIFLLAFTQVELVARRCVAEQWQQQCFVARVVSREVPDERGRQTIRAGSPATLADVLRMQPLGSASWNTCLSTFNGACKAQQSMPRGTVCG